MVKFSFSRVGAAALSLSLALGSAMSGGIAPAGAQESPQPQSQAPQIDAGKLQLFARAQSKVAKIGQAATQRMQSASTPEESQKIQDEAQAEMAKSVEDTGMTVEEFNQIATAAQADEGLRQKIEQLQQENQ